MMNKTEKNIPLILAPMAGYTDAPFRLLCRRLGADWTVSEMISAQAMVYRDQKTAVLAKIPVGDTHCALQIFGHDPVVMGEAAAMLASGEYSGCAYAHPPRAIDINMGCPVRKIVASGDGSALMQNPKLCGQIVAAVYRAVQPYGLPVTVKIRAGWDSEHLNAVDVAAACAENGAAEVAVHGRTRNQMYAPSSDNRVIYAVRRVLPSGISVIGNGDVRNSADAHRMLEETGCDGIMIGREALGNPWIFGAVRAELAGIPYRSPAEKEIRRIAMELIEAIVQEKGEERGVRESRGRAAHFIRGMRGSSRMREELNRAVSLAQIREILFLDQDAQENLAHSQKNF